MIKDNYSETGRGGGGAGKNIEVLVLWTALYLSMNNEAA